MPLLCNDDVMCYYRVEVELIPVCMSMMLVSVIVGFDRNCTSCMQCNFLSHDLFLPVKNLLTLQCLLNIIVEMPLLGQWPHIYCNLPEIAETFDSTRTNIQSVVVVKCLNY